MRRVTLCTKSKKKSTVDLGSQRLVHRADMILGEVIGEVSLQSFARIEFSHTCATTRIHLHTHTDALISSDVVVVL